MQLLELPHLEPEIQARLRIYRELLIKWQAKINLVGPDTLRDAWRRHFVDSYQISSLVQTGSLYDIGTGAGFPGLVLAIVRPDLNVTLIESDTKKCAFLTTVSRETGTDVQIVNCRIENATVDLPPPGTITARALAPLTTLLALTRPWTKTDAQTRQIFLKGANYQEELDVAKKSKWNFEAEIFQSRTSSNAAILSLTNVQQSNFLDRASPISP